MRETSFRAFFSPWIVGFPWPGRALADMAAGAYPGMTARSLDDFRSLRNMHVWLERVTADE
jgi:hypothetical protein